jgi:hypothetical protein
MGDVTRKHVVLFALLIGCAAPVRFVDRPILWRDPDDAPIRQPRSLNTSTEVVASRLAWAAGWLVPSMLADLLHRTPREPDGTVGVHGPPRRCSTIPRSSA